MENVEVYNARFRVLVQSLLDNEVPSKEYELFMRKMKTTRMSTTATIQKLTGVISKGNLQRCLNLYTSNILLQRMVVPKITFNDFCDPVDIIVSNK